MNPLAYEGEYGFQLQLNTDFDMTGYTPTFMFGLPDGTRVSKSASAVTTLADGDLEYTVEDGFFTQGKWWVQIWLAASGVVLKGAMHHFTVAPPNTATP
jgi:hypothetical protein